MVAHENGLGMSSDGGCDDEGRMRDFIDGKIDYQVGRSERQS